MKALLIVDVQNDFCPGGALPAKGGDEIIPVINNIMDQFGLILASRDWHPMDTDHFEKWPVHCVKNTKGAEFHPDLNETAIDHVFLKGTGNRDDGYSAFDATNANLEEFLKDNQVTELYVCGLATDYCVKHSAIDASNKGIETYVIADAVKAVNASPGDSEKALEEMKDAGVQLIEAKELSYTSK